MSTTMRGACTARVRSAQKTGLTLIFLICVLNYMDRGTLSVATPLIRQDLGLSVAAMGVLLSAFLWPYAFALVAAGGIVGFLFAAIWWSVYRDFNALQLDARDRYYLYGADTAPAATRSGWPPGASYSVSVPVGA